MKKLIPIILTFIFSISSHLFWTNVVNSSTYALSNEHTYVDNKNTTQEELEIKREKVSQLLSNSKQNSSISKPLAANSNPKKSITVKNTVSSKVTQTKTKSTKIQTTKTKTSKSTSKATRTTIKSPTIKKVARTNVTKTVASRNATGYGELIDWWTSASKIFSIGSTAKVTDLQTKKSFYVIRTFGTNHADVEAKTLNDTKIIKEIWGGFSWERRAVIVEINGRRIAASMTAMPHAGVDSEPALKVVDGRSGGYGTGENLDKIKGNGMDGHIDIHFLNSTRHKDGAVDREHQIMIKKAAGF